MSKINKDGSFFLDLEEGVRIYCKQEVYRYNQDGEYEEKENPFVDEERKTKFQLIGKNGKMLTPQVDNIVCYDQNRVLELRDNIHLEDGTAVTFYFMTDLTGRQISEIGNSYEQKLDKIIILDGNTEDNFTKYERYKEQLKERIQNKVDRRQEEFQNTQEKALANYLKKKDIRYENKV